MRYRTAVRALLVGLGAALSIAGCASTPQLPPTAQRPTQAPVTNPPVITYGPAPVTGQIEGEGEYIVGTDIQPGTYRSKGPASRSMSCFYQRYADLAKEQVIDTTPARGSAILEVLPTDKLVVLTNCQPFVPVG